MNETKDIAIHKKLRSILVDFPAVEWTLHEDKFVLSMRDGLVYAHLDLPSIYLLQAFDNREFKNKVIQMAEYVIKSKRNGK